MILRFFSFEGRSGRLRWTAWAGVTVMLLWLCLIGLVRAEGAEIVVLYAAAAVAVARLATESVRRLHDCGQRGAAGVGPVVGTIALVLTAVAHWMGYGGDAVFRGALALAAAAVAALMLRPGRAATRADDAALTTGKRAAWRGTAVAAGFLVAGVAFGLAVLDWQAAMARAREERTRSRPDLAPPLTETDSMDGNRHGGAGAG